MYISVQESMSAVQMAVSQLCSANVVPLLAPCVQCSGTRVQMQHMSSWEPSTVPICLFVCLFVSEEYATLFCNGSEKQQGLRF